MRRVSFASSLALVASLALVGCGGSSPYEEPDAEAVEGTGELPDGAVERALNPGDAGTVGPANLDGDEANAGETNGAGVVAGETNGAGAVAAKPVSYEQFLEVVAAADGPVLVDCWGTWCPNCHKAFPHTVALAGEHADEGLTVVSLAFDSAEKADGVAGFLTEWGAGRLVNLRTDDGGETPQWDDLIDAAGGGAFPLYLVFNADGQRVAGLSGGATEAELDAAVRSVLGG